MSTDVKLVFEGLKESLAENGDAARAKKMSAYLRDQFQMYGLSSPQRKEIFKPFYHEFKPLLFEQLVPFVNLCWDDPYRELQYCGMELLGKGLKHLNEKNISDLEKWVSKKSWWDTVDFLASTVAGHLVKTYPDSLYNYPDRWIDGDNMWLQRTAIIYQLKYRDQVDEKRLFSYIISTKGSKEFFINKATGWSLRSYARYNPEVVKSFISAHPDLSNLTKREALKHL